MDAQQIAEKVRDLIMGAIKEEFRAEVSLRVSGLQSRR